ncbi:MAG: hypothetical protein LBG17_08455 [Bacteroidales bacterium]|jgi:ATP-dependent exoDNAse (exonuclease V) beta subunit|nr:hypothetical protein [Bacteroidales bacterium]
MAMSHSFTQTKDKSFAALTLQNIVNFFSELTFEESTHTYKIGGIPVLSSVSALYHRFQEPFDALAASTHVAKKLGKKQEDILDEWKAKSKASCLRGTVVHNFAEKYMFDKNVIPSSLEEKAVKDFFDIQPDYIDPIGSEIKMYHKTFLFAGTCDALLYNNKTNKYIICDWKTNSSLFKNYKWKKLLSPFDNMLDTPFSLYQLQLSYYQLLLEQIPEIEVEKRCIVWILPDGTYQCFLCNDYRDELYKTLINAT